MDHTEWRSRLQTADEVTEIYRTRMVQDFPANELRPLKHILQLLSEGVYLPFGIYSGEECLAYAYGLLQPDSDWMLLDYYAVRQDLRGNGIGNWFLQQLKAMQKTVLIESENPVFAETSAARTIQERRVAFYLRSGAQLSGTMASAFGVPYRLLVLSPHTVSDEAVAEKYEQFYRKLTGERYEQVVRITMPEKPL